MTFTVKERVLMLTILQGAKGDDVTALRIISRFMDALSFSEEEHSALQFEDLPTGGQKWNPESGVAEKEIEVGKKLRDVIEKNLQRFLKHLNEQPDAQPLQFFVIFDKFFPEEKET